MHRDPNFKKHIQVIFSHSNSLCSKAFFRLKIRARTGSKEHSSLRFCWILMSFAMITVANSKLTSTQLLRSCCQIVKGCLLDTRIPITWCMYPSTKRRASSDNLVPETDSMHPVIQLHFSIQLRIEPENERRVSIIVIQLWNFLVQNCSSEIKDI